MYKFLLSDDWLNFVKIYNRLTLKVHTIESPSKNFKYRDHGEIDGDFMWIRWTDFDVAFRFDSLEHGDLLIVYCTSDYRMVISKTFYRLGEVIVSKEDKFIFDIKQDTLRTILELEDG